MTAHATTPLTAPARKQPQQPAKPAPRPAQPFTDWAML